MPVIGVSPDRTHFRAGARPFFYLADTVWAAFSNLPESLWPDYLAWRRRQGFTALQISILPVAHDASTSPDSLHPFVRRSDGRYDFRRFDDVYFDKAERMVAAAAEAGLLPVLGVLWCCYVPETGACKRAPIDTAMPRDAVAPYAEAVARRFKPYHPVFFISGDTGWNSPYEPDYYATALEAVRAVCPDALITMHLGTAKELPDAFVDRIDFYMYQSGHRPEQKTPYQLARRHSAERVKRPVVNGEPCYEGHGKVTARLRHTRFDVRKAIWQSLLSGARAGTAYGAHGVWSCHLPGMGFLHTATKYEPYPWHQAVRLEGAWDAAFTRWIWEDFALYECECADLLDAPDEEVAVAATPDRARIAVYNPVSYDIGLRVDLAGYHCRLVDLETRETVVPVVEPGAVSRVRMSEVNRDTLLLARRSADPVRPE